MKTNFQLREYFEITLDKDGLVLRLKAIYEIGLNHGRLGWFPDGEYDKNGEWVHGVGHDIRVLENTLQIEGNEIMELYEEGHEKGLAEFNNKEYNDGYSED